VGVPEDNLSELVDVLHLFDDLIRQVERLEHGAEAHIVLEQADMNTFKLASEQLIQPLLSSITTAIYRLLYHECTLKELKEAWFHLPPNHIVRALFDALSLFDQMPCHGIPRDIALSWPAKHERALYLLNMEAQKYRPARIETEKDRYLTLISQIIESAHRLINARNEEEMDKFVYQPNCQIS